MLVRKIDLYIQLTIAVLSLLSIFLYGAISLLLGMLLLGGWQLLSALLNTLLTRNRRFGQRIRIYWLGSLTMITILILASQMANHLQIPNNLTMLLLVLGGLICLGLAAFYWYCCKELISELNFDNDFQHIVRKQIIS